MTGRLLRANQVLFSWKRLGCWSYLVEQWPYRMSWIIVYYEDHEQEYTEDTALRTLYTKFVWHMHCAYVIYLTDYFAVFL